MKELKDKISLIVEQSTCDKPACKNCKSYSDGTCIFSCVNERNSYGYRLNAGKRTTPEYSCSNFEPVYNMNESTIDVLNDIMADIERVNEAKKNLELLLSGKITEADFVELMK